MSNHRLQVLSTVPNEGGIPFNLLVSLGLKTIWTDEKGFIHLTLDASTHNEWDTCCDSFINEVQHAREKGHEMLRNGKER